VDAAACWGLPTVRRASSSKTPTRGRNLPTGAEAVGSADSGYVDGVAKLDQRLPILLNPDGLLAGVTLAT